MLHSHTLKGTTLSCIHHGNGCHGNHCNQRFLPQSYTFCSLVIVLLGFHVKGWSDFCSVAWALSDCMRGLSNYCRFSPVTHGRKKTFLHAVSMKDHCAAWLDPVSDAKSFLKSGLIVIRITLFYVYIWMRIICLPVKYRWCFGEWLWINLLFNL